MTEKIMSLGREITRYDNGTFEINKQNYPFLLGNALKLGRAYGYLYDWEVLTLQVFVRSLPENALVVNIGAGAGTSAFAMAEARPDLIQRIYTVDIAFDGGPLGGLVPEQNAFAQYNMPLVNQILGDSYEIGMSWKRGKIDLIFIDGNHSELGVIRDVRAWLPHMKRGGFMLFHDWNHSFWPAIAPTVENLLSNYQERILINDLLAVYRIFEPMIIVGETP